MKEFSFIDLLVKPVLSTETGQVDDMEVQLDLIVDLEITGDKIYKVSKDTSYTGVIVNGVFHELDEYLDIPDDIYAMLLNGTYSSKPIVIDRAVQIVSEARILMNGHPGLRMGQAICNVKENGEGLSPNAALFHEADNDKAIDLFYSQLGY